MDYNINFTRQIRRIVCIQLSGVFPDFQHRLIMPDYGMPVIGSVLSEAGYDVIIYMEHIEPPSWDVIAEADLICMSTMSCGAGKTYALADCIRATLGLPVIIGGTHATYFARNVLEHCDYVVLGEGDETVVELVTALSEGRDPRNVGGIAYMEDGRVQYSPPRQVPQRFDTIPDYRLISGYKRMSVFDMLRKGRIPLVTAQTSRGCVNHCSYCIVETMFGGEYRKRDIESVIIDLKDKRQYSRKLFIIDNEFSLFPGQTKALLRRIIEEDLDYDIAVLAGVHIAQFDELLTLMRQAGIRQLHQGYESVEPKTLIGYHKKQSVEQAKRAIAKLHSYGFHISGSFVVGADTDTLQTVKSTIEFIIETGLTTCYLFPLWGHYIERRAGNRSIIPRHRAIFKGWAYTDGNFVTHFPMLMRPSQLQQAIIDGYKHALSPFQVLRTIRRGKWAGAFQKATRRVMWLPIEKGLEEYVPWLKEIEDEFYDEHDCLMEDRLLARFEQDPPWRWPSTTDPEDGVPAPTSIPSRLLCATNE